MRRIHTSIRRYQQFNKVHTCDTRPRWVTFCLIHNISRLILGLHPTNERRRYKVKRLSLAGHKPRISLAYVCWLRANPATSRYDNEFNKAIFSTTYFRAVRAIGCKLPAWSYAEWIHPKLRILLKRIHLWIQKMWWRCFLLCQPSYLYPPGLLHRHCNHTVTSLPVRQPWKYELYDHMDQQLMVHSQNKTNNSKHVSKLLCFIVNSVTGLDSWVIVSFSNHQKLHVSSYLYQNGSQYSFYKVMGT